jgi:MFS family permease
MVRDQVKVLRINYAAGIMDGAFFGGGIGFASFATILPLFVATMTDSAMLIGLISALHVMGWQIPQLLVANRVARMQRFKPMVMWMTIHERIPFLGLALIALLYTRIGTVPAIILTFLMIAWQGFGAGFTANPWQNMIGKVIPSDYLATFFGLQSSAANLLASGTAIMAGVILEKLPFSVNFAICFLICSGMLVLSYIALAFTIEPASQNMVTKEAQIPIWTNMRRILREDRTFVWFLVSRSIVQFGTMAFGFYTVYAVVRMGASEVSVGILTSVLMITQVIANPLLGWLADRWSRKGALEVGAFSIFLSALLAWFAPSIEWLYPAMILAGLANTAFWTVVMAVALQFGKDEDRPTYVGMANTLVAPATIIAPLLGGWLADSGGYKITFMVAAAAGLLSTLAFHFFVADKQKNPEIIVPPTAPDTTP